MGGSFGGSSRSSSSRSYSSPSRSSSRGYSSRGYGGGGGGYSRGPSVIIAPQVGGYGYYGGGGFGGYGAPVLVRTGPSIVDVIIFGVFATFIFSSFAGGGGDSSDSDTFGNVSSTTSALGSGVSVAQISVALNVPKRNDPSSILSFLDRLSATASTDSRVGVSNLVSQVALELLRQKRSIFAADTVYTHYSGADAALREFNSVAFRERSKFEKEGTNKFGGVDYSNKRLPSSDIEDGLFSAQATSAVITLIVAIDGDSTKLPQINNISDLEMALTRLATDVKVDDCLRSAEVLWTPDEKTDYLSERDVVVDYPKLRSV